MRSSLRGFDAGAAGRRLVVVTVLGVLVGAVVATFAPWQIATMAGWDTTGVALVVWIWCGIGRYDASETARHSTIEDNSRIASQLSLLCACVASLLGVAADLIKAGQSEGPAKILFTSVAVATVAISWLVVHTQFTLRYAHEFYTDPVGGIDFNSDDGPPDYHDFAYLAFTVGMTFQTSDTDIRRREIRRSVLRHALLAYLFGAVIVAVTVNVIASAGK